jgi:hypothetical protein
MTVESWFMRCSGLLSLKMTRRWLSGLLLACLLVKPALASWSVVREPDPLDGQIRCLIRSGTVTVPDGYGDTPVTIVGNGQKWIVMTESELDTSFADLELVVDEEPPFTDGTVEHNTYLVFAQDYSKILEQFKAGLKVTVYLRFWPTWPVTQRFAAEFSLIGFTKATQTLPSCR